jgi:hypothetical protein
VHIVTTHKGANFDALTSIFFKAYKMWYFRVPPSTARIRINMAVKIHGIEIHAGGMIFFNTEASGMG